MNKPSFTQEYTVPDPNPRPAEYARNIRNLAILGVEIASRAPVQLSPAAEFVTVDARLICELRAVLDTMGVDWKAIHTTLCGD